MKKKGRVISLVKGYLIIELIISISISILLFSLIKLSPSLISSYLVDFYAYQTQEFLKGIRYQAASDNINIECRLVNNVLKAYESDIVIDKLRYPDFLETYQSEPGIGFTQRLTTSRSGQFSLCFKKNCVDIAVLPSFGQIYIQKKTKGRLNDQ
tara:strand:- start:1778 stop:2239 length:462 start_codon:yes stop_codon:yes gene_type:complete